MIYNLRISRVRKYIADRPAFLDICIGPPIPGSKLLFNDATSAFSLGFMQNWHNINLGMSILRQLGIQTDDGFRQNAALQGMGFNNINAIVYLALSDTELGNAIRGESKTVERYRALLALYIGNEQRPIMRINILGGGIASTEFLSPNDRGLDARAQDDPISGDFVLLAAQSDDDQLLYFLSLLQQIHHQKEQQFKIARYFSLLEAMTSSLRTQFEKQTGTTTVTRAAIRFSLGYFIDLDVPRFTIEPDEDFEFDHIELAGRLRHKLFHGGGVFTAKDAGTKLSAGIPLLEKRPDMISHLLRRDCESIIGGWARKEGVAWKAANGHQYRLPDRDPSYDGRELTKYLISSSHKSYIASAQVQVTGGDIGLVRLKLSGLVPSIQVQ